MRAFPALLAVSLLSWAGACHRERKTERMDALDRLRQAGLLTSKEYEAKKAALTGSPPAPVQKSAPEPAPVAAATEPPTAPPPSVDLSPPERKPPVKRAAAAPMAELENPPLPAPAARPPSAPAPAPSLRGLRLHRPPGIARASPERADVHPGPTSGCLAWARYSSPSFGTGLTS